MSKYFEIKSVVNNIKNSSSMLDKTLGSVELTAKVAGNVGIFALTSIVIPLIENYADSANKNYSGPNREKMNELSRNLRGSCGELNEKLNKKRSEF
ncbi:TPA: hypothetical protein QB463_002020 [Pasteurella multocida]|nr:hypothetical protein [Pasteurella multocida]